MADKGNAKKDQNKNKKLKPNDKKPKKAPEGIVKDLKDLKNSKKNNVFVNKSYSKGEKPNWKDKKDKKKMPTSKFVSKPKSGSFLKNLLYTLIVQSSYVFLFLGFLYLVDYEKFLSLKNGVGRLFSTAVSYLPESVVSTGSAVVKFVQPMGEVVYEKVKFFGSETLTFMNTNPLVKEHWANIRDISSISSARFVEYIRTLYLQLSGFCNGVKNKIF